jgi:hypothetical protein
VSLRASGLRRVARARRDLLGGLPDGRSGLPNEHSALSNARSGLPNEHSALSNARSGLSDEHSALSNARSELPDGGSELSYARTGLPDEHSALSNARTGLSDGRSELSDALGEYSDARSELSDGSFGGSRAHPSHPAGRLALARRKKSRGDPVPISRCGLLPHRGRSAPPMGLACGAAAHPRHCPRPSRNVLTTVYRVRAVLKINRNNTASVLGKAHAVKNGMAADPQRFTDPDPSFAVFDAQVTKLELAEQRAATRAIGTAAARDVERSALVGMLETQRSYVQKLCDASPEQAVAIVQAAGMEVAGTPVRDNPILDAKLGSISGSVILDANAAALAGKSGKKVCFNWQWTTDGGTTFHSAPSTPGAKTTIEGLPALAMAGFRVSVTSAAGPGEWSQIVSILVQ